MLVAIGSPNHLLGNSAIEAYYLNPWFTKDNVSRAIEAIAKEWLNEESLGGWIAQYPSSYFPPEHPMDVGVIMAGNIPLVGFHDFLCVLITGNRIRIKLSSRDGGLMSAISQMLCNIEPRFTPLIQVVDGTLKDFDAVIATGSDSSAKYFEYYFRNHPALIRGHRNGVALLTGDESSAELELLSDDIYSYFGLGCRNVSKLLVPKDYNFSSLIDGMQKWRFLINHHRYANNYEYARTINLINQTVHLDTGFSLIVPNEDIDAGIATINYQEYSNIQAALSYIDANDAKIQCLVAQDGIIHPRRVNFGETQQPKLNDYADGIDTIEFLGKLNR